MGETIERKLLEEYIAENFLLGQTYYYISGGYHLQGLSVPINKCHVTLTRIMAKCMKKSMLIIKEINVQMSLNLPVKRTEENANHLDALNRCKIIIFTWQSHGFLGDLLWHRATTVGGQGSFYAKHFKTINRYYLFCFLPWQAITGNNVSALVFQAIFDVRNYFIKIQLNRCVPDM